MQIQELIASGANVNITVSVNDLQAFARTLILQTREQLAQTDKDDEYLTAPEVCRLLGVAKSTLWVWDKKSNLLHPRRVGRKTLYLKSEVQSFANNSNK